MATTTHQTTDSSRHRTFISSALFPLVFLVSLLLPTLLIAPAQAMQVTPLISCWSWCVLLFLSVLLLWPLGFVRRAMRRGAPSPQSGRKADREGSQTPSQDSQGKPPLSRWGMLPHLASWLAGVLCALNVLFLIGLVLFLIGLAFLHGVPPMLTTLFALALVSAVLTVGSVVGTILAWWGRFWSVGRRVHYTLVTLAALAFAWELVYWNPLGFRA